LRRVPSAPRSTGSSRPCTSTLIKPTRSPTRSDQPSAERERSSRAASRASTGTASLPDPDWASLFAFQPAPGSFTAAASIDEESLARRRVPRPVRSERQLWTRRRPLSLNMRLRPPSCCAVAPRHSKVSTGWPKPRAISASAAYSAVPTSTINDEFDRPCLCAVTRALQKSSASRRAYRRVSSVAGRCGHHRGAWLSGRSQRMCSASRESVSCMGLQSSIHSMQRIAALLGATNESRRSVGRTHFSFSFDWFLLPFSRG
jgi:hypothetical protein